MKLKTLEISGFKSFANRTKIEFMPGITGVVGPNGSGKSNIIESIRWVMGETSAKGLRGDKMADVIFGGTNTRAPLNRAEVSITFDNTDHYLNSEYSEIRITRTLYRSGESKYQINGQTVRLRDVHELFMDSGLGRESFSIISQGRVESIFSAKPIERRSIIEDVAGVYKYKQNKEQAEKELQETVDNLHRVQDILFELENRIEPLAQQASRASDYLTTKEKFDQLDQARLVIELDDLFLDQTKIAKQLLELEQQNSNGKQQLETQNHALSELKVQRIALETLRDKYQAQIVTLTQKVEQLTGEKRLEAERMANRTQSGRDLKMRLEQVQQILTELQNNQKQRQIEFEKEDANVHTAQATLETTTEHADRQVLEEHEAVISEVRNKLVDAMQALTSAKNEQTYLTKSNQQNDANLERLNLKLSDLKAKNAAQATSISEKETRYQTLSQQYTIQKNEIEKAKVAGQKLEHDQKIARKNWFDALEKQERATSRLQSLQRLSQSYDGYFQGVKNLMRAKNQFTGIQGVVAELIQLDASNALAIETALGGALQSVVVDNEQTAKNAIQYLTRQRLGRVTFLPVSTIQSRHLSAQQIQLAQNQAGFIGVAADLVTVASTQRAIIQNLLGTTLIVGNLDHAQMLANRLQHRVRVITLDGQVINAGGSMVGGANRQTGNGLLAQQTEIDQLTLELKQLSQTTTTYEAQTRQLEQQLQEVTQNFQALQQAATACNEQVQAAAGELHLAQNVANQMSRDFEAMQFEIKQSSDGTIDHATRVTENRQQIQMHDQAVHRLQTQLDELTQQRTDLQTKVVAAEQSATALQIKLATVQAGRDNARVRLDDINERIQAETSLAESLHEQLAALDSNQTDRQSEISISLDKLETDLAQVKETVAEKGTELTKVVQSIEIAEANLQLVQDSQTKNLQALSDVKARQAELAQKIKQNESLLLQTYETTYDDSKQTMQTIDTTDLKTQLKLLKLTLNDIGTVNIGAIDEYQEVKTRYDFLNQQQADLLDAQNNLQTTMSEMDQEVITRFKTTFDAIAEHFTYIFEKMFGGGKAVLELTDPEHLLTTGVDIKAQPPGKKFQQMSLLSGGEKALTAISLLFAILEVRPVPFAVLDETEAALDEANVDRFAEYLHEVNERTQFIVITHRKGTMNHADVLYGVTMQEPGISTMVSVNLETIDS